MPKATDKELRTKHHNEQVAKFKLDDRDSALIPTETKPVFDSDPCKDHYKKTGINALFPAVKQILKNGEAEGIVWYTESEKLQQVAELGVIPVESLTGIAIGEIGKYILEVYKRANEGDVSNLTPEKLKLAEYCQSLFKLFRPLERIVNLPVPTESEPEKFAEFKRKITNELRLYIAALEARRDTLATFFGETQIAHYCPGIY